MPIYFITGNKNKFQEVKQIIPQIEHLNIDLPEIQEVDPQKIVEFKLKSASQVRAGEFVVEDISLIFNCLNDLPGPLIKWFSTTLGNEGLYKLVTMYDDNRAEAVATIGYLDHRAEAHYFKGTVKGHIVKPQGKNNFGWDPIFQPDGSSKTYAQMTTEEKNQISHRQRAFKKLKEYLKNSL